MHELLLFGQIPAARHEQLLNILAGLSAMQPHRVLERHVLFKPARISQVTAAQRGGTQGVAIGAPKQNQQANRNANTDVFFVHLVKPVTEDDFGKSTESMDVDEVKGSESEGDWQLRFKDTPQPGKRPTILRGAETTDIQAGDPQAFVEALGYRYQDESVLDGHQFILDNTVLLLHRTLTWPHAPKSIKDPLPEFSTLAPLDKSGSYVLEAKIHVAESNPTLIGKAERELVNFQTQMRGVIDMVAPERLALDTRALQVRPRLGMAQNTVQARG